MTSIKRFTKAEDYFISANYPECGVGEIARALGRSKNGVRNRINRLGLKGRPRDSAIMRTDSAAAFMALKAAAAGGGDEREILEALRLCLIYSMGETESARDKASMARTIMRATDRIAAISRVPVLSPVSVNISRFEEINLRRAEHRALRAEIIEGADEISDLE